MATRENQGLQIALIIFVMLTIVLIVSTFLFFRNFKEYQEKFGEVTAKLNEAQTKTNQAEETSRAFKSMIGVPETENKDAVDELTKKDLAQLGKSLAEADQNWRGLTKHLASELNTAHTRIAELTAQEAALAEKIAADETIKNKEIAEYTSTVAQTGDDLKSERDKFNQLRSEANKKQADLNNTYAAERKKIEDQSRKSGEQVSSLTGENSKLINTLRDINDRIQGEKKSAEIADGKISRVNQETRMAWLNVGTADGLRRQITFSVFDRDDSNPADAKSKGKIEVISVSSAHMAEARIIEDDLSNPIMIGDLIFSPAWQPGRPEHFALAGFMDVDGDRGGDRQLIRDLITHNGGVIDAELSEDGKITGKLTINTKYLVLGDQPELGAKNVSEEQIKRLIDGYSDLQIQARTYGVSPMKVKDFVDYMGYKVEDRTVRLGHGINSADFKARMPEGVQRVRPGTLPGSDMRRKTMPAPAGSRAN